MPTRLSDRFTEHLRSVDTLTGAGIEAPKEWLALRERFDAYQRLEKPATDRLATAVVTGTKDDLTALRAFALAEQATPQEEARVDNQVAAAVERRLLELYAKAAPSNYAKAAAQFDAAATAFTAAAATIDTEAAAASMVTAPDDARAAWVAAEQHAAQLSALTPVLAMAADLAGTRVHNDEDLLPLVADPGQSHRRRVWEAFFHKEGRTGRWGALHRAGVSIRACPLDQHQPYRAAKPIEVRQEQAPGQPVGFYKTVRVDPEDPNYKPAPIPAKTLIGGRMTTL